MAQQQQQQPESAAAAPLEGRRRSLGSGEPPSWPPTCSEHLLPLDCFCPRQRRLACAQCPAAHPLALEAAARRNHIVDRCEKLQLQSATIAKFVEEVLVEKKHRVVNTASRAREVLIQRLTLVRSACESEEQRLLEVAQREEDRAQQSLLTQQAHWKEALQKLEALRTYLVTMVTTTDDHSLVEAEEEIFEKMEAAEGILQPQESEKLNFHPQCLQSSLVSRLWALAAISQTTDDLHIDEKTVSPLLALSTDRKTLTFHPQKARKQLDGPARFDHWPNALAEEAFCTGTHAWRVDVSSSCAYKLGVASSALQRKGSGPESRLGHNPASWVFSRYGKEFQFSHCDSHHTIDLLKNPTEIGVLIDLEAGELLFFEPRSCVVLHTHCETFAGPLYPALAVADRSISLL